MRFLYFHIPRMFISTDNRLGDLPQTHFISDSHTQLEMISKSVPGLAIDTPCSVCCRGWTTHLVYGSLVLYLHL